MKDFAPNQNKASREKLTAVINSDSPTPQVKKAAIDALVQLGDPEPVLVIAPLVQNANSEVASEACWAIGELRNRKTSPQAVLGLQHHADPLVRGNCALAVGRIGDTEGTSALNAAALNEKEDIQVRLAAIQALAMTDPEHASSLTSLLANSDPQIRAAAAYSACQLQLPGAIDSVKAMLDSSDQQTRDYGLQAAGVWPEKFAENLAKLAAHSRLPLESRLIGLTTMEALPKEQKEAVYAKFLSPLVKPDQPPDIQVAAAQVLSRVPSAKSELNHIANDGRRAPELLDRLNDIGIQTVPPVSPVTYPPAEQKNFPGVEGLLGAVVGAALVLLGAFLLDWFRQRAEPKVDRLRKKLLWKMLTDERFKEQGNWRRLETLMQVIGADRETTTRLLVELGARGSEKGNDLWGLVAQHPFEKE